MSLHRPSREMTFMGAAELMAARSTCARRGVGAIVTVHDHIVSSGWNGPPPGDAHCSPACFSSIGCERAIHAEANAIAYVPEQFHRSGKIMYTTESPCMACASLISHKGFHTVYYLHEYRLDAGIRHLLAKDIAVYRMTPSGYILKKSVDGDLLVEQIC